MQRKLCEEVVRNDDEGDEESIVETLAILRRVILYPSPIRRLIVVMIQLSQLDRGIGKSFQWQKKRVRRPFRIFT